MAKFFESEKAKRRAVSALSLMLSATLTLGIFSACSPSNEEPSDDDETNVTATDAQSIKNGNFEFYGEMDELDEEGNKKHKQDELRAFINSPNDWSFSSGSPSSDTSSGIINAADWEYMSKSSKNLILESDRYVKAAEGEEADSDGYKLEDGKRVEAKSGTISDAARTFATQNWEDASLYDRLKFYSFYNVKNKSEFALYADYKYSVDFNDLEYLGDVLNDQTSPLLRSTEGEGGRKADETSLLMIHNYSTLNNVAGTAQYYTSRTTITLNAGTAAKLSVWVRTSELEHYTIEDGQGVDATRRTGAYIGVTNTVGGTTLDQMQIKYINTHDAWQQYTVYVRANTFASTTFTVVLGLGQGNSDNRYYACNGFAFFDDLTCDILSATEYEKIAVEQGLDKASTNGVGNFCDLNSKGDAKKFDATDAETGEKTAYSVFALDLDKTEANVALPLTDSVATALTEEVSGSQTYTSEKIDPSLSDTSKNDGNQTKNNVAGLLSLDSMKETGNDYLRYIYQNDFAKFPFLSADAAVAAGQRAEQNIIMLLSSNGAAYTAKVYNDAFTLGPKERKFVSFFVKTSEIRSGKTGASAILVDGENKSTIAAFDSTKVATVDIQGATEEETVKDIYNGWVRCFFFVQNETEEEKSFHLELTYGPTAISGTSASDYSDGYAAFANFEVCDLTKSQYSYAATGTYAQKVSLTASVKDSSKFDNASANGTQLENGLALPVNYTGVQAGSNYLVNTQKDEEGNILNSNPGSEELAVKYGLYTGLLSSEYAEKYLALDAGLAEDTTFGEEGAKYYPNKWLSELSPVALPDGDAAKKEAAANWWKTIFGNNGTNADSAYQPLVIINTTDAVQPAYGYFASSATVSANATTRISVRVKLSANATAYIYLSDVTDVADTDKRLAPTLPAYTYWYDDDGNIVKGDPSADGFDEKNDILYTLEENGLYKKAGDEGNTYYANLSAFERDDDNNYVTKDGTIAFFHNPADTDADTAYAYYNKNTGVYSQPVVDLPHTEGVRYTAPSDLTGYEACIKVTGSPANADRWVNVSFYVQAGNEAKNYRLELWAGARDAYTGTGAGLTNGIPAKSYVFFDRCATETVSNYDTLLQATKTAMLDYKDADGKYPYRAENVKDMLASKYALYYTFTFYDSPDYLRYDKTQDEDKLGDPWGSYVQSDHEEALTWLYCEDMEGELLGSFPTASLFLSYASNEVTVTPDELGGSNDTTDNDHSSDSSTPQNGSNFWLLLSSILLAAALIFAVIAVGVRRLVKKYRKPSAKAPKAPKTKRSPKLEVLTPEAPEEPEAPVAPAKADKKPEKPVDEDDPYNE